VSLIDYKTIIQKLHSARKIGYGKILPSNLDKEFINLASYYLESTNINREKIRSILPDDTLLLIIGFSDRMCILADRNKDKNYLLYALAAHSIEDFRYDYRENIIRLALIYHVAEKLGLDSNLLFNEISSISSQRTVGYLTDFLNRPSELKRIDVMNIVEIDTPDGVIYKHQY
jgi:hypothetical protein